MDNLSPSDLSKKILYMLDFRIIQIKDIGYENYTFFVLVLKEDKNNGHNVFDGATPYIYAVKAYKDNTFFKSCVFKRAGTYGAAILILVDKIIGKNILKYEFFTPSREYTQMIPSDFAFENSLFSMHLFLNLDFSSYNFAYSRKILDNLIQNEA